MMNVYTTASALLAIMITLSTALPAPDPIYKVQLPTGFPSKPPPRPTIVAYVPSAKQFMSEVMPHPTRGTIFKPLPPTTTLHVPHPTIALWATAASPPIRCDWIQNSPKPSSKTSPTSSPVVSSKIPNVALYASAAPPPPRCDNTKRSVEALPVVVEALPPVEAHPGSRFNFRKRYPSVRTQIICVAFLGKHNCRSELICGNPAICREKLPCYKDWVDPNECKWFGGKNPDGL